MKLIRYNQNVLFEYVCTLASDYRWLLRCRESLLLFTVVVQVFQFTVFVGSVDIICMWMQNVMDTNSMADGDRREMCSGYSQQPEMLWESLFARVREHYWRHNDHTRACNQSNEWLNIFMAVLPVIPFQMYPAHDAYMPHIIWYGKLAHTHTRWCTGPTEQINQFASKRW